MRKWNYRLMKYEDGSFGLHEVYYNADGSIDGYTKDPVGIIFDTNTNTDMEDTFNKIRRAFSQEPILYPGE